MGERSWEPLAIAILGLLLAIMSYGIKDGGLGNVVYVSGLVSAGLSLAHWFGAPEGL
jgi:hypothetical protein